MMILSLNLFYYKR